MACRQDPPLSGTSPGGLRPVLEASPPAEAPMWAPLRGMRKHREMQEENDPQSDISGFPPSCHEPTEGAVRPSPCRDSPLRPAEGHEENWPRFQPHRLPPLIPVRATAGERAGRSVPGAECPIVPDGPILRPVARESWHHYAGQIGRCRHGAEGECPLLQALLAAPKTSLQAGRTKKGPPP